MALNNLAAVLSALGRRDAALAAAEGARDLYRTLAAARPDAFTPDLAHALARYSEVLGRSDNYDAACEAMSDAIALCARRSSPSRRPSRT
jgi:tetratricopeptide (TPR) repeat protein